MIASAVASCVSLTSNHFTQSNSKYEHHLLTKTKSISSQKVTAAATAAKNYQEGLNYQVKQKLDRRGHRHDAKLARLLYTVRPNLHTAYNSDYAAKYYIFAD